MKDRYLTARVFAEEVFNLNYEFKEVNYESSEKIDILAEWKFMGIDFKIVMYELWVPCAYIRIPDCCKEAIRTLKTEGYDYIPKSTVNWWFTFGKYLEEWNERWFEEGRWLGWDYWHCDDYAEYMKNVSYADKLKKWTTKEILVEVFEQIITFFDEWVLYL